MLEKNIIKHPKSRIEIELIVPWITLEPKWNEIASKVNEPELITKLKEEFLKKVMRNFLIEAIKESNIIPIDNPEYNLISFEIGQNLHYAVTLTNAPFVIIGDYKNINITKYNLLPIEKEAINETIIGLYKKWQKNSPTEDSHTITTIDKNFLKSVGTTTLEDLEIKIKQYLEQQQLYDNEIALEKLILDEIEKITLVELPDILIEDELNRMLVNLQRKVADMGLMLDNYLSTQNKTLDQLRKDWKTKAEKNVKIELGLAKISKLENIIISESDLQNKIDTIQDAKIKQQFVSKEARLHLRHSLRQTKTLNHLKKLIKTVTNL